MSVMPEKSDWRERSTGSEESGDRVVLLGVGVAGVDWAVGGFGRINALVSWRARSSR